MWLCRLHCWNGEKRLFPSRLTTVSEYFSTELVSLSVSPDITAECGKPVTLTCNASSSQRELSIKRMEWFQNRTSVCSVNEEGKIRNHAPSTRDSYCQYKHGQLSLTFKSAKPLDRGSYACKLQSSRGARHKVTKVELQGQRPSNCYLYETETRRMVTL